MKWMSYKNYYFGISGLIIFIGIVALVLWKLPLGIDFKGGTLAEYKLPETISTDDLQVALTDAGLAVSSIQKSTDGIVLLRLESISDETKSLLTSVLSDGAGESVIEERRFESVGPTVGPDLIKKTYYAIAIASLTILLWVALQFRSINYGIAAILAMFHDTFILIGSFALFGHYFGATVDYLFVTAVLTTLSFSVHDTIVVFDRIRELKKKKQIESFDDLANVAISQTMVRSLNNSFTIIFMLVALMLFGGSSVFWFAAALLIGTVAGTYSSPFIAVPILVILNDIRKK
jgi:preprotein translocase subunit SecF